MENIDRIAVESLLSGQVSETRRFVRHLSRPQSRDAVVVTLGGRERCQAEYEINRRSYAFHGVEYVAEGEGWVELAGHRQHLRPGSVFAYAPDMPCVIRTDPAQPMLKYFACVDGTDVPGCLQRAGLIDGMVHQLPTHSGMVSAFEELIGEGLRTTVLSGEIAAALFGVLLLRIRDAGMSGRFQDPARERFRRCKEIIDAEARELNSLSEVARRAGIEASSVCRLFRRFQGTSPHAYLLRRKMTLAAEYLLDSGALVKEAARYVGFSDPFHFSRCFKDVHGLPPRALRFSTSKEK